MITYEYDEGGNILNKKEYFYYSGSASSRPSETITYTYGNTNWKDQLTSYNGKAITYDEIGNILTYNGNTYTWQNGRQLAGIKNSSQTITYKYNDNGIRTQKTVDGVVTNYYLDGNKVIYEKTGSNIIYYTYDETGKIIGLNYNDTQYYYIRNGQNDIVGILDSNFNQVVSYEYDSWGNTISIKDANGNEIVDSSNIGIINPYRYRSYRYDTETGLYYLNSRYYNPEWGRFINADGYLTGAFVGSNLYAYCANNPINLFDTDGYVAMAIPLVGAISSTVTIYWPAVWTQIAYAIPVAWNYLVNTIESKLNGVREPLQKVQYSASVGGCGSFTGQRAGNTATPPSPKAPKNNKKSTKSSTNTSKGSTAQIVPSNLREQLALEQVKSMPENGKILTKINMSDPRWPATQGWVKMQQIIPTSGGNINVHYVWNTVINMFDDFKIVP